MTAQRRDEETPVLLDVEEAARRLGTKPRFVRRLITERRIEFHKVGRHVRISENVLADFIESGRMPVIGASEAWRSARRSA